MAGQQLQPHLASAQATWQLLRRRDREAEAVRSTALHLPKVTFCPISNQQRVGRGLASVLLTPFQAQLLSRAYSTANASFAAAATAPPIISPKSLSLTPITRPSSLCSFFHYFGLQFACLCSVQLLATRAPVLDYILPTCYTVGHAARRMEASAKFPL